VKATELGKDLSTGKKILVKDSVRQSGMYILGVPGQGKSLFLGSLIHQDLHKGYAVILFDPHDDLIHHVIAQMPEASLEKTYLLDMTDTDYPFGLNLFDCPDATDDIARAITVDRVMHIFEKLWPEIKGILLEKLLRYITLTFVEVPGHTLADIPRLLRDDAFRASIVSRLTNEDVKAYWCEEYNAMTPAERRTETQALFNRLAAFLSVHAVKNIVGQRHTTIDFQRAIHEGEVLLIRLPIKRMHHSAALIGTVLLAHIHAATFAFGDLDWDKRPGYSLYVDEFQNFATSDFADLFKEGRKFGIRITVVHQDRHDLLPVIRSATLTASTIVCFQTTPNDAVELAPVHLDSSVKLRPEHIYPDVLNRLRLHEHPEVQEFFRSYVLLLSPPDDESDDEPYEEQDEDEADEQEVLDELQDLLYLAVKTQVVDEELFENYTDWMFPYLELTFYSPERKRAHIQAIVSEREQTIATLTALLASEEAFEGYLITYDHHYRDYPSRHRIEWYYQPWVPEEHLLADTGFWESVLKKTYFGPYERNRWLEKVMTELKQEAAANDALRNRDSFKHILSQVKAPIIAKRGEGIQRLWNAIVELHRLKKDHAVYSSIRHFHANAYDAYCSRSLEQRGDPVYLQPVGSTRKRGTVNYFTRVEQLVIQSLAFEDPASRERVLAWLPRPSDDFAAEEARQQLASKVQQAWKEAVHWDANVRKLTALLADDTAILKGYYATIGKHPTNAGVWEQLNDEEVDDNVWDALFKEADRNAVVSRERNTVEKLIQVRKHALRARIALLTEELEAYKTATIPGLERQIAAEVAAIEDQRNTFRTFVRHIIEILKNDPGSLGEQRTPKESDIKEMLLNLPKRQALVRIGGDMDQKPRKYTMQTRDAPQAVKKDEAIQRLHRIREQTRAKYGRPRQQVEQELASRPRDPSGADENPPEDEPPEPWYEE
jgi:hypothetical protein